MLKIPILKEFGEMIHISINDKLRIKTEFAEINAKYPMANLVYNFDEFKLYYPQVIKNSLYQEIKNLMQKYGYVVSQVNYFAAQDLCINYIKSSGYYTPKMKILKNDTMTSLIARYCIEGKKYEVFFHSIFIPNKVVNGFDLRVIEEIVGLFDFEFDEFYYRGNAFYILLNKISNRKKMVRKNGLVW